MKKILFLVAFVFAMGIHAQTLAQNCPTGLNDCYFYGSLNSGTVNLFDLSTTVHLNLVTESFCPSGHPNCSNTGTYIITVTKQSNYGSVRKPGGTWSGATSVSFTYTFPVCGTSNDIPLEFKRTNSATSVWGVALTYVEAGQICSSGTWEVILEKPE